MYLAILNRGQMASMTSDLTTPLQTSAPHQWKDVWLTPSDFTCNTPTFLADLLWNRVSNLEPSNPETETLPCVYFSSSKRPQWPFAA
ncbi:hypothetical protein AVEN_127924-1 [Araneus ventricosus]|uniref:Uncharacterized protein n=1 Tax=Araneus ventricosus TaxID=182803 RepID=A0A4Y1ZZF0_ARAVE|nr:hypothetical protein AVEN_127924-1 [Araneus ventricosus]